MSDGFPATEQQAWQWAAIIHVSALVGLLFTGVGMVLAPLILWLIKRGDHPFIDEQGKEALNFQITMFLGLAIGTILSFILIGIPILLVVLIMMLVFPIIAAVKSSSGVPYRYPYALRLVK